MASKEKEKIEYGVPLLSWAETHSESNCAPEDGEKLFLVSATRLTLAPNRCAARRGVLEYVDNSNGVSLVYVSASKGQVFTASQMLKKTDEEPTKEARAEVKDRVAHLLETKAIVDIGKVESYGGFWRAKLSDEGRKIIEDSEAWLLAQVKTAGGHKHGEEIAPEGEDLFLVTKGQFVSLYGLREPYVYPALVAESVFDEGYRPDAARRAEAIAERVADGRIVKAGKIFPIAGQCPNILTGQQTRFRLELEKGTRSELEQLAEVDYWERLAAWKLAGSPGFGLTRLGRY